MSIYQALYSELAGASAVSALVGSRIYPVAAPESADRPYLTMQIVSGPRDHSQNGPSGLVRRRVQIDIWADAVSDLEAVEAAVRGHIDGFEGAMGSASLFVPSCTLEDDGDSMLAPTDDSAAGRFHRHMDFMIWHAE